MDSMGMCGQKRCFAHMQALKAVLVHVDVHKHVNVDVCRFPRTFVKTFAASLLIAAA
jgi:hypothetical protein